MEILACLNRCFPVAETEVEKGVQKYLGEINKRIVDQAQEAVVAGDAGCVGELMKEAQCLFDQYVAPACPSQLTAEVLGRKSKGAGEQRSRGAEGVKRETAEQEAVVGATLRGRPGVGEEPFLLLLGDHLYVSDTEVSCALRLTPYALRDKSHDIVDRFLYQDIVDNVELQGG